jgi:hypothetical protein
MAGLLFGTPRRNRRYFDVVGQIFGREKNSRVSSRRANPPTGELSSLDHSADSDRGSPQFFSGFSNVQYCHFFLLARSFLAAQEYF